MRLLPFALEDRIVHNCLNLSANIVIVARNAKCFYYFLHALAKCFGPFLHAVAKCWRVVEERGAKTMTGSCAWKFHAYAQEQAITDITGVGMKKFGSLLFD